MLLIEPLAFEDGSTKRSKYTFFPLDGTHSNSGKTGVGEKLPDSGIETSDLKSVMSSKQVTSHNENERQTWPRLCNVLPLSYAIIVPIEILFTAGKVALSLYDVDETKPVLLARVKNKKKKSHKALDVDLGYEAEEENMDCNDVYNKYSALIYFSLKQPNIFMSKEQLGQKAQISCFDMSLKLSGPEYPLICQIPAEEDFPVNLVETRSGVPDSNTGILPAFFTMKFSKTIGKPSTLDVEISKPTKVLCSLTKWTYLLTIRDKVNSIRIIMF